MDLQTEKREAALSTTDVMSLEQEMQSIQSELAITQKRLEDASRAVSAIGPSSFLNQCVLWGCATQLSVRHLADRTIGLRVGAFLICVALLGGLTIMATSSMTVYWIVSLSLTCLCAGLFLIPADQVIEGYRGQLLGEWKNEQAERSQVKACTNRLAELKLQEKKLNRRLSVERLRLTKDGRLQLYAESNWRELRGVAFETFLHNVFVEQGYAVSLTIATGDQGADLVLKMHDQRIAVQVKGYAGSVGNSAVQQVIAGRKFYDCHGMAVIANSRFTRQAKVLARKTCCVLVDEENLYDLVTGKLALHEMCKEISASLSLPPSR